MSAGVCIGLKVLLRRDLTDEPEDVARSLGDDADVLKLPPFIKEDSVASRSVLPLRLCELVDILDDLRDDVLRFVSLSGL